MRKQSLFVGTKDRVTKGSGKALALFCVMLVSVLIITLPHRVSGQADDQEAKNTAVISQFYHDIFDKGNLDLINQLYGKDYVDHDPAVKNGRDGLSAVIQSRQAAKSVITIKHLLADSNMVVVHSQVSTTPNDEFTGQAMFDLFRLKDGVIVEHWNITQTVPAKTTSGNSMFSDLYTYQSTLTPLTEEQETANRQMVVKTYEDLFNTHDFTLLDKFWSSTYIQHNPRVPNGAAGLKTLLGGSPVGSGPTTHVDYSLAEDDLVFTLMVMPDANSNVLGGVGNLFRVDNGQIVEHWDAQQFGGPNPGGPNPISTPPATAPADS